MTTNKSYSYEKLQDRAKKVATQYLIDRASRKKGRR